MQEDLVYKVRINTKCIELYKIAQEMKEKQTCMLYSITLKKINREKKTFIHSTFI